MLKNLLKTAVFAAVAVVCCQNFVVAEENNPLQGNDVVLTASPNNVFQTQFAQSLIETELFQKGFEKLTKKIDEEYAKNESKADFPKSQADYIFGRIADALDKDKISSADLIEAYFKHANAVIFLLNVDFDSSKTENKIDASNSQLVWVVDFNPGEIFDLQQILQKDSDYAVIKDGEGIYAVKGLKNIPEGSDVPVLGGTEIGDSGKYAIVFGGNEENVLNKIREFQRFDGIDSLLNDYPKILNKIVVSSNFIEKILAIKEAFSSDDKEQKENVAFIQKIVEKFESATISVVETEENELVATLELTGKTEDDAETFKNLFAGGTSLLKWKLESQEKLESPEKIAQLALGLIQVNRDGKVVSFKLKINRDSVETLIDILKPELAQLDEFLKVL